MSLRLKVLERSLPGWVKMRMLGRLAAVTAEGFGVDSPRWFGRDFEARLEEYAEFTALQAAQCVSADDVDAVRSRLRQGATRLGADTRRLLGVRSRDDAFAALRLLYRAIGIDLEAKSSGTVTMQGCYFAQFYSPGICCVVEALDQGVVDGLFAGASLRFSERITEGLPSCQARIRLWMEPSAPDGPPPAAALRPKASGARAEATPAGEEERAA